MEAGMRGNWVVHWFHGAGDDVLLLFSSSHAWRMIPAYIWTQAGVCIQRALLIICRDIRVLLLGLDQALMLGSDFGGL
jgi:hypothetical protein